VINLLEQPGWLNGKERVREVITILLVEGKPKDIRENAAANGTEASLVKGAEAAALLLKEILVATRRAATAAKNTAEKAVKNPRTGCLVTEKNSLHLIPTWSLKRCT
jgi:hypothetical protein